MKKGIPTPTAVGLVILAVVIVFGVFFMYSRSNGIDAGSPAPGNQRSGGPPMSQSFIDKAQKSGGSPPASTGH